MNIIPSCLPAKSGLSAATDLLLLLLMLMLLLRVCSRLIARVELL